MAFRALASSSAAVRMPAATTTRLSVGAAVSMLLAATAAFAGPVADLPGRWAGFGKITMADGSSEDMRCIATYFVEGTSVKQNLRCASQGYKIDATANLKVVNGQVSGDWEEKIWNNTGTVTGKMLDTGFNLMISGNGFTAGLALSTTNCKQTISISPKGYEISSISMSLGKC